MATLQIDDKTYAALKRRAAELGLSIEEWLRSETGADVDQESTTPPDQRRTLREKLDAFIARQKPRTADTTTEAGRHTWHERFEAYLSRCKPTGATMDDSRESIYD